MIPRTKESRRALWGVGDQALSSLTNVVVLVAAARALPAREFGAFSLVYTTWLLATGLTRALLGEPLLARPQDSEHGALSRIGVTTGALCVGVTVGGACVVAGLVLGGSSGIALLVAGAALGPLLYQDAWRLVAFAEQRPHHAFTLDAIWALLLVITLGAVVGTGRDEVAWFVAAWAVAGAGSAGYAAARSRLLPSWRVAREHFVGTRDLGFPFVAEYITANGSAQVAIYALGAVSGLAAVGAVRATMTFFGPINLLYQGIFLVTVPAGARLARSRPDSVRGMALRVTAALVTVTAAWSILGWLMPTSFGMKVFGETWLGADGLVVYFGLAYIGYSVAAGGLTGLRSLAAAKASLKTRLVLAPVAVSAPIVGALFGGAKGFAFGLMIFSAMSGVMWWFVLGTEISRRTSDQAAGT